MKQIIYIILAMSILISCSSKSAEDKRKPEQVDLDDHISHNEKSDDSKNASAIFIKDSSDYSTSFLSAMAQTGVKHVSLVDSLLILGSTDTVPFPRTPEIGRRFVLTAKQDILAIALTVERINQTTINYEIEMVEFGNTNHTYKGQADLNPHFYLGAETDESSLSGISYLSTEFIDNQDSCYTYIRLGRETGSGPYLLGKVIKNCNGKIKDIQLNNFPTLIEK